MVLRPKNRDRIGGDLIHHLALRRRILLMKEALEHVVKVSRPGDQVHEIAKHALKSQGAIEIEVAKGEHHGS